jgi:uncharacterized membrane protein YbhN (UPF0104 family)
VQSNNLKLRKTIILVVKIIIVIAAYLFAWNKLSQSADWSTISNYQSKLEATDYVILFLIFLLMFANWSLEAIKWKYSIRKTERIGFLRAFAAVWSGVTIGTITPNRIGEFAGRIMFLKPENRKIAATQTLYGDLSQFITTIMFGIIGISIFFVSKSASHVGFFSEIGIFIISFCALIISIFIFFYFNQLIRWINKIGFLKKIFRSFIPVEKFNPREKFVILTLSILRYTVFSFQFFLAISVLKIEISLIDCLTATSSMYLAVHLFPNIALAEPGVRISFSAIFFGAFTQSISGVAIASLIIYIINVLIPIFIGGINLLLSRRKISNSK